MADKKIQCPNSVIGALNKIIHFDLTGADFAVAPQCKENKDRFLNDICSIVEGKGKDFFEKSFKSFQLHRPITLEKIRQFPEVKIEKDVIQLQGTFEESLGVLKVDVGKCNCTEVVGFSGGVEKDIRNGSDRFVSSAVHFAVCECKSTLVPYEGTASLVKRLSTPVSIDEKTFNELKNLFLPCLK